jgi:hypothetical protein
MADYHSSAVVTPELPVGDVTLLERLILGRVFFAPGLHDGLLHFAAPLIPEEFFSVSAANLRAALLESTGTRSPIADFVQELLAAHDAEPEASRPQDIDIDLTGSDIGWHDILQDIVRRSMSLDEIVVWTAFTCTKMRDDGFGGSVTRITSGAIQCASTDQVLADMRKAPSAFDIGRG